VSTLPAAWSAAASFEFSGVHLVDTDEQSAADCLAAAVASRTAQGVHLCNAYTLALASKDPAYRRALGHGGAVNLPDGAPVSWYYRVSSGHAARGPVRGPGLMRAALDRPGLRHFLLGATEEVLGDLVAVIARDHPTAVVAGSLAPAFGDPTDADLDTWAAAVQAAGADVVWVGLGTPRQDLVIARMVDRCACVLVGVGAAFDFLSGHKAEAPSFLHSTGLEWAYRLASEPRRLWRRYLFGNTRFVVQAVWQLAARRTAGHG
jgi:N-acetylglucosaminyldiphosphoundecaprenol N-acetyl-beta-D-mannosaminyltransferase